MDQMALVETTALSFTYAGAAVPALKDVTLAVPRGKIVLLCGGSGSGKSTLLRLLKAECAPHGSREGEIRFDPAIFPAGKPEPGAVGLIGQDPEGQIVTDRVWQELVFGLESLGMPQSEMAARVAETVSYFGLESLYRRRTDTLSLPLSCCCWMSLPPSWIRWRHPTFLPPCSG